MTGFPQADPCPCGTGTPYDACCGPLHRQERQAATPEELMRSRYAAFAVGDTDHLFRTWHPRTRPADIVPEAGVAWTALEILGGEHDEENGTVEFRAFWISPAGRGVMHERSRFTRRGGRWVYVDGDFGSKA